MLPFIFVFTFIFLQLLWLTLVIVSIRKGWNAIWLTSFMNDINLNDNGEVAALGLFSFLWWFIVPITIVGLIVSFFVKRLIKFIDARIKHEE